MSDLMPLEKRLQIITGVLERARKYQTGLIVFVVFKAETIRAEVENKLMNWLTKTDQQAKKIQFRPTDQLNKADLMGYIRADPPTSNEVVFLYDIRHAFPGLLNSLNYRREFVPDNRWRLIFWVREEEIIRVMRNAPDFWAFVNQTIELPEIPAAAERAYRAKSLAWDGLEWGNKFRRLSHDERQLRIALRERLLKDLQKDDATITARAELRFILGVLYYYNQKFDKAKSYIEVALKIHRNNNNTYKEARTLNILGKIYHEQNQYEKAIKTFQQAIEIDPNPANYYNNLGNVHRYQEQYEEAIKAYQQAIEIDPQYAYPHNNLGYVYSKQGYYEEAIQAYQKAIEIDLKYATPYNNLGYLYSSQRLYEEAIQSYQQAIEIDPKYATPHNNLGNIYLGQGQYEKAIEEYQQAIKINPKYAHPYNGLGYAYNSQGKQKKAIEAYKEAIELKHEYIYPHNNLGDVYRDQGRYEEAIQAYQKAIKLDPKYANPYKGLGVVYSDQVLYEKAIQAFQQVIELDPKYGSAYVSLAGILKQTSRETEAAKHLATARELIHNNDMYNKACLEAVSNNTEAALDYLAEAVALASGDRNWAKRDPDLASLRDHPRFLEIVGGGAG